MSFATDELWTSAGALRLEHWEQREQTDRERETIAREPSGPRALEQVEEEGDSWTTKNPGVPNGLRHHR